ncbi:hypothetical protein DP163_gp093 [Sea otter poxvirus]|uniref:Uncharacterized protein n=1 Tax=Sea otter poxvirus TaxID=1416741 RepID=A0A2U9QHR2_9POXV|nr:hypothetical protein DP163_gp093 [Sea otter poxvirus]AWU47138.1 hypothetical protein [Sea otter poxvirus]
MDLRTRFATALKKEHTQQLDPSSPLYTINSTTQPIQHINSSDVIQHDIPYNATERYYQTLLRDKYCMQCPQQSTGVPVLPPLPSYSDSRFLPGITTDKSTKGTNTDIVCPTPPPPHDGLDSIQTSIKQKTSSPVVHSDTVEAPGTNVIKPLTPVSTQSVKDLTDAMKDVSVASKITSVDITNLQAALLNKMRSINPDLLPKESVPGNIGNEDDDFS